MLLWLEIYVTWMHFENLSTNFIFKLAPANSIIINIFCQYFVPAKKLFKYNYFHNKICENALEFDILHRINTPANKLFGCPPVHSCCSNWLRFPPKPKEAKLRIVGGDFTWILTTRSWSNHSNWNEVLASKDWNEINLTQDLDEKVVAFNKLINESLDEVAPYKTFKVRTNHKFGLSEETKELMKNREHARKMIQKAESSQKQIWNEKYKKLRNVINAKIRKENYDHNKNICQDITYLIWFIKNVPNWNVLKIFQNFLIHKSL